MGAAESAQWQPPIVDDGGVGDGLRKPPHSVEAEHAVLGALMLEPAALGRISDLVTEADFYRHEHRLIFSAISDLAIDGEPTDIITVFERLQGQGKAADVGGLPYLNELSHGVTSAANIRRYAEIIAERATLRAMIAASDEIAAAAFNPQGRSLGVLLDDAKAKLGRLADQGLARGARKRLPVRTGPQLIAEAGDLRWLCKGILPEESLGMLFGASGTFKSFLALDAMCHVVHGLPWLGRRTQQGPGLWIAGEGGRGFGHRVNAWHRARRLTPPNDLVGIPASIDLGTDAWRVVDAVQSTVAITPRIVVVDTLSQTYTAGAEENSATDMAAYLRELGARFRDLWKCTVIVIHHSGHNANDRPRGSSAIQANTDFLFGCWRDEKAMLASLSCEHMKDGDRFSDETFSLLKVDLGTDADGDRVSHLVARHLTSAEDVQEAMQAEAKAGRGGKQHLLLSLLQNGMREAELRKAFYEDCGIENLETRKKAYQRARAKAISDGFMEIAQGTVITLKKV